MAQLELQIAWRYGGYHYLLPQSRDACHPDSYDGGDGGSDGDGGDDE